MIERRYIVRACGICIRGNELLCLFTWGKNMLGGNNIIL